MSATLIVIAKQPVPGRVKTRLVPPLTHEQAAAVAGAALTDTLDVIANTPARQRILAFAGDARAWLPAGWTLVRQVEGGLDARLVAAFTAAGTSPALLVGMDTPQLLPHHLTRFDSDSYDACLGLAPDGGYWVIGFRDPRLAAASITGVPMSRSDTGRIQLGRLRALGLRVQLLDHLVDVDTIDDAHTVATAAPHSRFAGALATALAPMAQAG